MKSFQNGQLRSLLKCMGTCAGRDVHPGACALTGQPRGASLQGTDAAQHRNPRAADRWVRHDDFLQSCAGNDAQSLSDGAREGYSTSSLER